jgi:hypothetical protein
LTFGQFQWIWIGAMSAFGVIFIVVAQVFSRNPKAGHGQARQVLMGLLRSGTLREEEVNQALNAPHLPPPPENMVRWEWQDRILDGSPVIEELINRWKRPSWVEGSIDAGIGTLLACGACALFFLAFPAVPNVSASYGILFAMMMSLPLIGMLTGLGRGMFRGIFKVAQSSEQRAPGSGLPQREMERYRPRWLRWVGVVLFLVPIILTLSALPFLGSDLLGWVIISLVILPLLTLGALLLHEYFIGRLAYLPPVRVGADSALEERFDVFFFPRLMRGITLLEYGILGAMMLGQLMLLLGAVRQEATVVYAKILLGLVCSYLFLPVIVAVIQERLHKWRHREPARR